MHTVGIRVILLLSRFVMRLGFYELVSPRCKIGDPEKTFWTPTCDLRRAISYLVLACLCMKPLCVPFSISAGKARSPSTTCDSPTSNCRTGWTTRRSERSVQDKA